MLIYDDLGKLVTSVEDQGEELLCLENTSRTFPTYGIYVKHKTDGFIELLVPMSLEVARQIKANGGVENLGGNSDTGADEDYHPLPFPIYNNKPPFPYYLFSTDKAPDEPVTDVIDEVLDLSKTIIEYGGYDPDYDQTQHISYITLQLFRKDGTVYMNDDDRIKVKYLREGWIPYNQEIVSEFKEALPTNFDTNDKKYHFVMDPKYYYYHMVFTVNDVRVGKGAPKFDKNGDVWIDSFFHEFTMSQNEPNPSQFVDMARANINYSFDKKTKLFVFELVLPNAQDGKPYVNGREVCSHLRLNWVESDANGKKTLKTTQIFLEPDENAGKYIFTTEKYLTNWNPTDALVVIPYVNNVQLQGVDPLDKYGELTIIKPTATKRKK